MEREAASPTLSESDDTISSPRERLVGALNVARHLDQVGQDRRQLRCQTIRDVRDLESDFIVAIPEAQ
jgi:hypothetical protein